MELISQVERRKRTQKRLGLYLVEAGVITPAQLNMALDDQKVDGRRLGEILVAWDWVKQDSPLRAIDVALLSSHNLIYSLGI